MCMCIFVSVCLCVYLYISIWQPAEATKSASHPITGEIQVNMVFFLCKLLLLAALFWLINLYKTVSINWCLIQLQPLKMSRMKVRIWFLPLSLMLACEIWTGERKVLLFMKGQKTYWNSFSSLICGHLLWFTSENPRLFPFKPGLLLVSHSAVSLFPCKAKFVAASLCKGTF